MPAEGHHVSPKTIWMISGNKGGVGKSLLCLALASALEMRGQWYSVFDGDGRTGDVHAVFHRKCPSRWGDFRQLRPDSHNCSYDAVYEGLLHQLLRATSNLIVNTPDGADTVLMKWFDTTLRHTETHNYLFKFIYLMSDRPDGLDLLPQLAERFQFLYPVRNLHFGPPAVFTAFKEYAEGFQVVLDLPALRSAEVRMLFDMKAYPAGLLQPKEQGVHGSPIPNLLARSRLRQWQARANESLGDVIDNQDMPNLVYGRW